MFTENLFYYAYRRQNIKYIPMTCTVIILSCFEKQAYILSYVSHKNSICDLTSYAVLFFLEIWYKYWFFFFFKGKIVSLHVNNSSMSQLWALSPICTGHLQSFICYRPSFCSCLLQCKPWGKYFSTASLTELLRFPIPYGFTHTSFLPTTAFLGVISFLSLSLYYHHLSPLRQKKVRQKKRVKYLRNKDTNRQCVWVCEEECVHFYRNSWASIWCIPDVELSIMLIWRRPDRTSGRFCEPKEWCSKHQSGESKKKKNPERYRAYKQKHPGCLTLILEGCNFSHLPHLLHLIINLRCLQALKSQSVLSSRK